jgi:hypothetical protein
MLSRAEYRDVTNLCCKLPTFLKPMCLASSLQAGEVVAHAEPPHLHHGEDHRGAEQPHLRTLHHHLHLCRHGHAALRQELHRYTSNGLGECRVRFALIVRGGWVM